ncbi:MAG: hypothetical protein ACK56I_27625, partial [bacterium]
MGGVTQQQDPQRPPGAGSRLQHHQRIQQDQRGQHRSNGQLDRLRGGILDRPPRHPVDQRRNHPPQQQRAPPP